MEFPYLSKWNEITEKQSKFGANSIEFIHATYLAKPKEKNVQLHLLDTSAAGLWKHARHANANTHILRVKQRAHKILAGPSISGWIKRKKVSDITTTIVGAYKMRERHYIEHHNIVHPRACRKQT